MKRYFWRGFAVLAAVLFLSLTVLELTAEARAGRGGSFGSRGSRSYSRQVTPSPTQSQPSYAPRQGSSYQQPAGGGFMRSMAGGMMGGVLGSMLFSGMAGAGGAGGTGGGGVGLFEIILLAGGGYFLYRFLARGRG